MADNARSGQSLTTFGEASALLAVMAAGVYVLGLVALWMPIYRTYTHNLSTAWYAVSLVPRTVVAGQGAGLLAVPIVVVVFTICFALVTDFAGYFIARFLKVGISGQFVILICIWTTVIVAMLVLTYLIATGAVIPKTSRSSHSSLVTAISTICAFLAGGVVSQELLTSTSVEEEFRLNRVFDWRKLLKRATISTLLVFTGGLALAADAKPPLPSVSTIGTDSIEGTLLAHVDRVWYVFDREGNLVALPDDEVRVVRISSS